MGRVRRVLLGDGGAAELIGTVLVLGVGVALTWSAIRDIRAAVAPARLACAGFLVDPAQARWVALHGCRLDVSAATVAWWRQQREGTSDRELLLPVTAQRPQAPTRLVLATSDPALVALVASLDRLPVEEVDAAVAARAGELEAVLAPKELTGPVTPLPRERRPPGLEASDGVFVLEHSQQATRLGALGRLVAGLLVMLLAFWPAARRFQLERELAALTPPPGHPDPARPPPEG